MKGPLIFVAALSACVFLGAPWAADADQAVRLAALLGVSAGALASVRATPWPGSGLWGRRAAAALAAAALLWVASAAVNGPATALWGQYTRFNGAVAAAGFVALAVVAYRLVPEAGPLLPRWLGVALGAQSVIVIGQRLAGVDPSGTGFNTVVIGGWLAVAASAVLAGAAGDEHPRWRALRFASVGLAVVAVGVTGSRGAVLAVLAGIAVIAIASNGRTMRLVAAGAAGILLLAVLAGGLLYKYDPADLATGSAAQRLHTWSSALDAIVRDPLLGVGPGRFVYGIAPFERAEAARMEPDHRADVAHSQLVQAATEFGIPATLSLLAVFGGALILLAKRWRREPLALAAGAGLAAYVAQGAFGVPSVQTDALGWAFAATAFALADARPSQPKGRRAEQSPVPAAHRRLTVVTIVTCAILAIAALYYVVADTVHKTARTSYEAGAIDEARRAERRALALNPYVEAYRLGMADIATAEAAMGVGEPGEVFAIIDEGLELEPGSHELAIARARLLFYTGADPVAVADGYERALELYPIGATARWETALAAARAGRDERATALVTGLQGIAGMPTVEEFWQLVAE